MIFHPIQNLPKHPMAKNWKNGIFEKFEKVKNFDIFGFGTKLGTVPNLNTHFP